jgi:hypothetical protein
VVCIPQTDEQRCPRRIRGHFWWLPEITVIGCLVAASVPLSRWRWPMVLAVSIYVVSMTGQLDLPIAQSLNIVSIGRSRLVAFPSRLAGLQLHGPQLVHDQCRARPLVVGILGQQMPAEHGRLARHGDGRDLMATPARIRKKNARRGPGALEAAQAASTSQPAGADGARSATAAPASVTSSWTRGDNSGFK